MDDNISSSGVTRRAKACSICRRKKVKCDGTRPICASCKAFDLPCHYEDSKRRQERPNRDKHVSELEKRIQALEDELHQAPSPKRRRLLSTRDEDDPELSVMSQQDAFSDETDSGSAPYFQHASSDSALPDRQKDQSAAESIGATERDEGSYALKNTKGAMRFFGASSLFSIVPHDAAHSFEDQTPNQVLRDIAHKSRGRWKLADWYPQGLQNVDYLNYRCPQPLPPKPLQLDLVREYFENNNVALPLFDPTRFIKLLHGQFSWNPNDSPSWWAAFNVVLAFAYRNRAENSDNSGDEWQKCIGHIKNAMSVITELFMRTCDLLAAQAMIGLSLFFQGTPNPQPLFMFTAAAIRVSQSIGLHKSHSFGLSEPLVEERQRVFWIAFMLDADICTRTGRPAAQDTRDFDTPLPLNYPQDGLGIIEIQGVRLNFFSLLAEFALVQRRVYDRLYSTEASRKPLPERIKDARVCIEEIDRWKNSSTLELRPQRAFVAEHHPLLSHILRLHFACHCCYINIYRVCLVSQKQPIGMQDSIPSLAFNREEAVEQSLEAARSAIDLISQIEDYHLGQSFEWSVLYFPAAATVALFSEIIANPTYAEVDSDLRMITRTVKFLSKLACQEQDTYVDYVLSMCSGFEKAAKKAIEHSRGHKTHTARENQSLEGQIAPGSENQRESQIFGLTQRDLEIGNDYPNYLERPDGEGSTASFSALVDQGLPITDPLSFPVPLSWNWQDMVAGVPPTHDLNNQF